MGSFEVDQLVVPVSELQHQTTRVGQLHAENVDAGAHLQLVQPLDQALVSQRRRDNGVG